MSEVVKQAESGIKKKIIPSDIVWLWFLDGGVLCWRKRPRNWPKLKDLKNPAGYLDKSGHWIIKYNGIEYRRDVLIFALEYGYFPDPQYLVHLNGKLSDDRPSNLGISKLRIYQREGKAKGVAGRKYISKLKNKNVKQGFIYSFEIFDKGVRRVAKTSISLDKVVAFRNSWLQYHRPDLFKYLRGE